MSSLLDGLERLIAPLRHKIATLILKGVLETLKEDTDLQVAQVFVDGEPYDGLERIQQYGFTSVPEEGAETVILSVNGNKNQSFIIAIDDHRYRLKGLAEGSVALYTNSTNFVLLKPDGKIEIHGNNIELGAATFKKLITEDILAPMAAHIHSGVTVGAGSTGTPVYTPPLSTSLHATQTVKAE